MGRGRAKVWGCWCCLAGDGGRGWRWEGGGGGGCVGGEMYSELWLNVVAASLGVTVEEAVCVITDGIAFASSVEAESRGEGTRAAAVAIPCPGGQCGSGGWAKA